MYKAAASLAKNNYRFRSLMYFLLVRTYARKSLRKYWRKAWKTIILPNIQKPVQTKLHGFDAVVNTGFSYPLVARTHHFFNNPLLELAHQVFIKKGKPIYLVDIGAAVGDTVFFLEANLPGAFKKILCIDGDKEFYTYLVQNMKQFDFVQPVNALLSSGSGFEKDLVRIHAGTASAQGDKEVTAISLDELVETVAMPGIDILKIDTDGFDGRILRGANNILTNFKPAVIFEWHPILVKETGNELDETFKVLASYGYSQFVFYTKYGNFSHFMSAAAIEDIHLLAELCFNNKHDDDWHYDVIAIYNKSLDVVSLAEASFAKKKTSVC